MMKKVLLYIPRWHPSIGGMEIHVDNLVRHSKNYQYEIMTAAVSGYPESKKLAKNVKLTRIKPNDRNILPFKNSTFSKASFPYRYLADSKRSARYSEIIEKGDYDILHLHYPYIPHTFAKLSKKLNKPVGKKKILFKSSKPHLMTVHGLLSQFTDDEVLKQYEKDLINNQENVICVDKKISDFINSEFKNKNIWLIPNSLDLSRFSFKPFRWGNKLKVGFVGRLEHSRGVHLLEALIKDLPDFVELYVVGSGNEIMVDKFKAKASKGNFQFRRNVPNEKLPEFLKNIDVLFNPVLAEGASRISLEAMACGRAAIMTDKGDRYPIINKNTGYLVKPEIEDIISTLNNINESRDEVESSVRNARNLVEKEFSNEVIIPKIEKVYEEVMRQIK